MLVKCQTSNSPISSRYFFKSAIKLLGILAEKVKQYIILFNQFTRFLFSAVNSFILLLFVIVSFSYHPRQRSDYFHTMILYPYIVGFLYSFVQFIYLFPDFRFGFHFITSNYPNTALLPYIRAFSRLILSCQTIVSLG